MPFDIGIPELGLIFAVVLMVFGPGKIPEIARNLGKAVGEIRRVGSEFTRELTGEPVAPSPPRKICPRCASPNPVGNYFCFQCGMDLKPAEAASDRPPPSP